MGSHTVTALTWLRRSLGINWAQDVRNDNSPGIGFSDERVWQIWPLRLEPTFLAAQSRYHREGITRGEISGAGCPGLPLRVRSSFVTERTTSVWRVKQARLWWRTHIQGCGEAISHVYTLYRDCNITAVLVIQTGRTVKSGYLENVTNALGSAGATHLSFHLCHLSLFCICQGFPLLDEDILLHNRG